MNKGELLKRVNSQAQRYDEHVTNRQMRDWVEEELVPQAIPHGRKRGENPNWEWNCQHYRRILQICRIRKSGSRRTSQIRIELWLRGIDVPFDLLQMAFLKEYRLIWKSLRRQITSESDPRFNPELLPRRINALIQQMGELSPALSLEDFQLSAMEMIAAFQMASFGQSQTAFKIDKVMSALFDILTGMLGDPGEVEENAVESVINKAPKAIFEMARIKLIMLRSIPLLNGIYRQNIRWKITIFNVFLYMEFSNNSNHLAD